MWGGQEDQSEKFIRRGYWFLGWGDDEQPSQARLPDQIRPGDRLAIKRTLGQGSPNIAVRALGAQEIDQADKRIYVKWFVKGLERGGPAKGCFARRFTPHTHRMTLGSRRSFTSDRKN